MSTHRVRNLACLRRGPAAAAVGSLCGACRANNKRCERKREDPQGPCIGGDKTPAAPHKVKTEISSQLDTSCRNARCFVVVCCRAVWTSTDILTNSNTAINQKLSEQGFACPALLVNCVQLSLFRWVFQWFYVHVQVTAVVS